MANLIGKYKGQGIDLEEVTCLFDDGELQVYWLGIDNVTAFRCNVYMIKSGNEALIIDPGSREFFEEVKERALQVASLENIKGLVLCHQDPDVAASMVDWLEFKGELTIFSSDRTNVLLPHYGKDDYNFYSINAEPTYSFGNGREIKFVEAPFLHFPGAFVTYDASSRFLFSGDIWAALDIDWKLVVDDFEMHVNNMNLFHLDYMASNIATRGFIEKIKDIEIDAILPQHGSIIDEENVEKALIYLKELRCGTDLIYS